LISTKKRIASWIARKHSPLLEVLSLTPAFAQWAREHPPMRSFVSRPGEWFHVAGLAPTDPWIKSAAYPASVVDLYRYVLESCFKDRPLDYLEFGVYTGRTLRIWATITEDPEARLFGFDSFQGLPEDWDFAVGKGYKKGAFTANGVTPSIGDPRITLIPGWFHISVPTFMANYHPLPDRVVHIDCDLHSSTLAVLSSLHPILSGNTVVIFDEFDNLAHEFRAFRDYCKAFWRDCSVVAECDGYRQVAILFR
jgi:O-methyltransferase